MDGDQIENMTSRNGAARAVRALLDSLCEHAVLVGMMLLYAAAAIVAERACGLPGSVSLSLYSTDLLGWSIRIFGMFVLYRCIYTAIFIRPARPVGYVLKDLRENYLRFDRVAKIFWFYLFFPIFMSAFTSFKAMIPAVNPFCWDEAFARWDGIVHGTVQPWRLLHPVLGHPPITRAVNFLYNIWFLVLFIVLFWQGFSLRDRLSRMRFLYTFVLTWVIVGTLGAMLLSSAGPCYYGRVTEGPDIYAPLMEYLQSVDAMAISTQDTLWDMYINRDTVQFAGISAMPSMHVSMALLFVLIAYKSSRALGRVMVGYLIVIIIGSVHLAWHYAIDAYAAIAVTWLIWWAVGRMQSLCSVDSNRRDEPSCSTHPGDLTKYEE